MASSTLWIAVRAPKMVPRMGRVLAAACKVQGAVYGTQTPQNAVRWTKAKDVEKRGKNLKQKMQKIGQKWGSSKQKISSKQNIIWTV